MANATKTVKSSGGDYTSLNAALAGLTGNLTTDCAGTGGAGILTIECYAMQDTTAASTGTGYTTSSSYYINIIGAPSEKTAGNTGKWSTGRYRLSMSEAAMLTIAEQYVRVTDLQFNKTGTLYDDGGIVTMAATATSLVVIDGCVFKGSGEEVTGNYSSAIQQSWYDTTTVIVRNTLIYDWIGGVSDKTAAIWCYSGTITVQNVTLVNCQVGIGNTAGTVNSTNVGMSDVTTATSGTVGQTTCSTTTPTFVDANNDDFHLASGDTTWCNAGTDLSATFTTDIDGQTRSGTWDIGADEYVAAGGASIPRSNPFSRPFSQSLGRGGL